MLAPNNRKRRSSRRLISAGAVIAALVAAFFLLSPGLYDAKQAASHAATHTSTTAHTNNKSKTSTVAKDAAAATAAKVEAEAKSKTKTTTTTKDTDKDYDDDDDYKSASGDSKTAMKTSNSGDAALHESSNKKKDYDDDEDNDADYSDGGEDYKDTPDVVDDRQHSVTSVKSGTGPTTSSEFNHTPTATAADDAAFLKTISECTTHECITEAHKMPRSPKIFNFPHFMIIGFQKSATTSLFKHLEQHPDLVHSTPKEPNYFSYRCNYNPPEECDHSLFPTYLDKILNRKRYMLANGTIGPFEGSTHYLRGGVHVVRGLREMMPWLKLIINIREPISRAASMLIHNRDSQKVGCLMRRQLHQCLLARSQIKGTLEGPDNYLEAVRPWFEEWPADQIHVIQYEELTEDESEQDELHRVKHYLGINEEEPKGVGLGLFNVRRFKIRPEGWKMPRDSYEKMLRIVKPDVEGLLDLLEKYGKVKSRAAWLERWQQVWDDNTKSCNDAGQCNILLS